MIVNKIFIREGQIALHEQLDSEKMNPVLLRQAKQILSTLRAGMPTVTLTLADNSKIMVSLGRTYSAYAKKEMREEWQNQFPEADPVEYNRVQLQREESERQTCFGLTYQGVKADYWLVLSDTKESDPRISGIVAGTTRRANNLQESSIARITQEIVNLKPGFIPPTIYLHSVFGDHFAVAMLLSASVPHRTPEIVTDSVVESEDPEAVVFPLSRFFNPTEST